MAREDFSKGVWAVFQQDIDRGAVIAAHSRTSHGLS
eukprot:CAMPEP_0171121446 /NCGR_PEP_ID=MMETSP0766_2-20121228/102511_1 /TAXON_ID=439317 /ORGANISM="Gambierdiscus australes, Strain CAWD 149" /LENGTH=35 /DNA_ID= /DNA_START= /DNA_END= /DNA_ORIENTATION=